MGDPIEVSGLTQAFQTQTDKKQFCALGAVKTNVGHLQIASGVVGFIKTVLALQHKQIPPPCIMKNRIPRSTLPILPLYQYCTTKMGNRRHATPGRCQLLRYRGNQCACSARGSSHPASNLASKLANNRRPVHLLTLSAKEKPALNDLIERYREYVSHNRDVSLADLCFTANTAACTLNIACRASTIHR